MQKSTQPAAHFGAGWLFILFISAIYSAVFSASLLPVLNFSSNMPELLLSALGSTLVLALLLRTHTSRLVTGILAGAGLLAALALVLANPGAREYFPWLGLYLLGEAPEETAFMTPTVLAVSLLCSLLFYVLCYRFGAYLLAATLGACILLASTLRGISLPDPLCYTMGGLLLLLYVMGIYRHAVQPSFGRRPAPPNPPRVREAMLALLALPFLALSVYGMVRAPKSTSPVQIGWLDKMYNNLYESLVVVNVDSSKIFSAGYQVAGNQLDGPCYPNDIHVLDVQLRTPTYLKCSVSDTYTGYSWNNTLRETVSQGNPGDESVDSMTELEYGSKFLAGGGKPLLKAMYGQNISVTFRSMKANYLFTPLLFEHLVASPANAFIGQGGQVLLDSKMSHGYTYSLTGYGFDYGSDAFQIEARGSYRGLYKNGSASGVPDAERKWLESRSDFIYAHYLQLPSELPARVRALAKKITANAGSDYGKAAAIEQYLATTESYTFNPPQRPAGQDLVDFFLFESQQGYCTSYATSMVVLARCIGLPARYCQGYVMPSSANQAGVYEVTNRQAHAWVEVYLEGLGWVPFEPTSAYWNEFYTAVRGAGGNLQRQEEDSQSQSQAASSEASSAPSSSAPSVPQSSQTPAAQHGGPPLWAVLLIVLAVLAIALVLSYGRARRRSMARRLGEAGRREAALLLFEGILWKLRLCGFRLAPDETAFELRGRLRETDGFFSDETFNKAIDAFAAARYGADEPTPEQTAALQAFDARLNAFLPGRLGRLRWLLLHTVLGLI